MEVIAYATDEGWTKVKELFAQLIQNDERKFIHQGSGDSLIRFIVIIKTVPKSTSQRKQPYYDKLREVLSKKEWDAFIDDAILNADEVFQDDYDDVEAQIYMERKMYDHLVKFCLHTSYNAEENLEKYAKYMSESDQRIVAQDITVRMKQRAPECKRGKDYDHFANWMKRLAHSSPVCEQIAKETAREIVKENPNKAFGSMFERIGVIEGG